MKGVALGARVRGEPPLLWGPGPTPQSPVPRGRVWRCSDCLLDAPRSPSTPSQATPPAPQAQVSTFKRENEALRCGQGASLTVVKQNTEVALQNLRVVMNSAHSSIK